MLTAIDHGVEVFQVKAMLAIVMSPPSITLSSSGALPTRSLCLDGRTFLLIQRFVTGIPLLGSQCRLTEKMRHIERNNQKAPLIARL